MEDDQNIETGQHHDPSQGSDDISSPDDIETSVESDGNESVEDLVGQCKFDDRTTFNGVEDMAEIDMRTVTFENIMQFHFLDVDVAFIFYNWYASVHGFAARKGKVMRNSKGEVTQQTFHCHKEGTRQPKHMNNPSRKRRARPLSRCGCKARCMVHVETTKGRWYIKMFEDSHNHPGIRQTSSCFIYTVTKYRHEDLEWRVSYSPTSLEFKCSCLKLESHGFPCEHLFKVFVHLDIVNLPECVVLKRWTKNVKDSATSWNVAN